MQKFTHIASLDDLGRKLTETQQYLKLLESNFKVLREKTPDVSDKPIESTVINQSGFFLYNLVCARTLFCNIGVMTVSLFNPALFRQGAPEVSLKAADHLCRLRLRTENFIEINKSLLKSIATVEAQHLRYNVVQDFILKHISSRLKYQSLDYSWTYAYHANQATQTDLPVKQVDSATYNLFFYIHLQNVDRQEPWRYDRYDSVGVNALSGKAPDNSKYLSLKRQNMTLTDVVTRKPIPIAKSIDINDMQLNYTASHSTLWFEVEKRARKNHDEYHASVVDGKNCYHIRFGATDSYPELVAADLLCRLSSDTPYYLRNLGFVTNEKVGLHYGR
jgi:hypothetical protein